jgi:hypothetical protein
LRWCGPSGRLSAHEYRGRLAALDRRGTSATAAIQRVIHNPKSIAQIQQSLRRFAAMEDRSGEAVGRLRPPKDAQKENDLLAQGDHLIAEEIRAAIPELSRAKDPGHAVAMLVYLPSKGEQQVERARAQLKKMGYIKGG